MYRDDRSAVRARLEAARDARDQVLGEIRERTDAIKALNEQLERRALEAEAVAEPNPGAEIPAELDGLSLAEELRLCDALEQDATRLTLERDRLATTVALLNDRAQGRSVREPLGAPPRQVPASYVIAEFFTWYGAFAMAAFALGVGFAGSDPGAAALGPIGLCLLLTLLRPWSLEFRFLGVLIFNISTGVVTVGVGAWLAKQSFVHAHPVIALATGAMLVLAADAWHAIRRRDFLARCKVASARLVDTESTSSTYKSWPLPYGRGWESGVESYTGSGNNSTIAYRTDEGYEGRIVVKGPPWEDAVVLYDPDRPERALPVQAFGCGPRPKLDGSWRGGLGGWRAWRVLVGGAVLVSAVVALIRQ